MTRAEKCRSATRDSLASRFELPLLGSNQDSPDPESGVLPVTPRGSAPKIAAFSAPRIPHRRERGRDLLETRGIIDGGRHAVLDAIGNLLDRAAEDLTRARLRQTLHHDRQPERRDRRSEERRVGKEGGARGGGCDSRR